MRAVEHREDLQCCPECGAMQMHEQFKDVEVRAFDSEPNTKITGAGTKTP